MMNDGEFTTAPACGTATPDASTTEVRGVTEGPAAMAIARLSNLPLAQPYRKICRACTRGRQSRQIESPGRHNFGCLIGCVGYDQAVYGGLYVDQPCYSVL